MTPPVIDSIEGEQKGLLDVARLMLIAARTAPKSAGIDDVLTLIAHGREKNKIADKMEVIADQRKTEEFRRDAENVRDSEAIVLVGVRGRKSFGLDCGACGCKTCEEFVTRLQKSGRDFVGPTCLFKILDLGIALGSAAKIASDLNVDNRIMYRIGVAAVKLRMLPEASVVMGIPISAGGKSIYFDRPVRK